MSRRTVSIRASLLRNQILVILLLSGAILGTTFLGTQRAVRGLSRAFITRAVDLTEGELRRFFDPVDGGLATARWWGESGLLDLEDPARLSLLFVPYLERYPQISSLTLANPEGGGYLLLRSGESWRVRLTRVTTAGTETGWFSWDGGLVADGRGERSAEDPRQEAWYRGAVEKWQAKDSAVGSIYWSEPYLFSAVGELGLTAAVAFDSGGAPLVVAFDVRLDDMTSFTRSIEVSESGSVTVLTSDLRFVAVPDDPNLWLDEDPLSWVLKRPADMRTPLVTDAAAAFAAVPDEEQGRPIRFLSESRQWWGQARPFALAPDRGLLIVVLLPGEDLVGDRAQIRYWILAVTLAVLLGAILRAAGLARRFSQPIEALVRESERMSQGNLEPGEPVESRLAEVQSLAVAQDRMRFGLQALMRMERDLQLARQIQQSTFPARLPELKGFDLEAWNQPADETGGDTYDVIGYVGPNGNGAVDGVDRAILLLADAAGHGIGPALSVTQLRAMLRMAVRMRGDLTQVAQHMNEQLFADLPHNRFITAWLGELQVAEHTLTTFSAGQGPLLCYRAASRKVEVLDTQAPPFGMFPELKVSVLRLRLEPGDIYAVISDGFYDAMDSSGQEFGAERVSQLIVNHAESTATEILEVLRSEIVTFTGDSPAEDDRTALIIRRIP